MHSSQATLIKYILKCVEQKILTSIRSCSSRSREAKYISLELKEADMGEETDAQSISFEGLGEIVGPGGMGRRVVLVVCFTHQLSKLAFDSTKADDNCFFASSI